MSTEWYLSWWARGEPQAVAVGAMLEAMAPLGAAVEEGQVVLTLPDQPSGHDRAQVVTVDTTHGHASGLVIIRPLESDALKRVLYGLMRLGDAIIYAPDAEYPVTLGAQVARELPAGMIDSLGRPRVAATEDEFCRLLAGWYGSA
ncbi:MAG: hypothetical protein LBK95_13345 [Bifidobacteriaceae bacterium]|jgi:hypothetical protein|nr:hypothetical protein [Bifidobacteriaceae bacterium]